MEDEDLDFSVGFRPKKVIKAKLEIMKEIELEEPIGNFIIKNAEGVLLQDGQYYHFSEVCKLLNLQKESIITSLCITAPEPPLK